MGSGFFDRLTTVEAAEGIATETEHNNTGKDRKRMARKSLAPSLPDYLYAIKRNIAFVLNARKGCCLSAPELGLEDFNDAAMGSADMLIHIARDIRDTIERFESRVTVHAVECVPSDANQLQLGFRIQCSVITRDKQEKAEIELLLDRGDRLFKVY